MNKYPNFSVATGAMTVETCSGKSPSISGAEWQLIPVSHRREWSGLLRCLMLADNSSVVLLSMSSYQRILILSPSEPFID